MTSKKPIDETEDDESEYDEESPSSKVTSLKKKKVKISEKNISVVQKQGKGSATTTSLLGCARILEVMTRPLSFFTINPLGPKLTRLLTTTKGIDEGGQTSPAAKGKNAISEEEEKGEGEDFEGNGSSGHEKLGEEPSFALGTDIVDPTHSIVEEMDELGFLYKTPCRRGAKRRTSLRAVRKG